MSDILVVKVNMFCRSRELNDIRRYILSQIENGKVVVLPAYCDAQIVPDDIEIRVEDLFGDKKQRRPSLWKFFHPNIKSIECFLNYNKMMKTSRCRKRWNFLASCSFFRQDYILFQTLSIFGRMDYRYQKYRI